MFEAVKLLICFLKETAFDNEKVFSGIRKDMT